MAARKKRKSRFGSRVVLAAIAASVVVLSLLITANEKLQLAFLPTWDQLFSLSGFGKDAVSEGELRLTVLDVGNADCILVQNNGHAALIDAGENKTRDEVLLALDTAGVRRLDYAIATHADADHIGGMDEVVRDREVGTFLMPFMPEAYTPTTRTYENLLEALLEKEITPVEPAFGSVYELGDARLTILSGQRDYKETNNQSIVCRITFGEHSFLLMGDAEREVEEQLLTCGEPLSADVIKVGHHGGNTSSMARFIQRVAPRYAVITCGLGNPYGHPHEETIRTLEQNRVRTYRSDLDGTIVITSDGHTLSFETER